MHLPQAIQLFLLFKQGENLSSGTIAWYTHTLGKFHHWLADNRTIQQLTAVDIALYLAHERGRGLAPSTIDGHYRALQALLNWCEDSEEVGRPPSAIGHGRHKRVKRPKVPDKTIRHVQPHEYRSLIESIDLATWLDYRDWSIFGVLYWSGLRRAELCALTTEDIDFLGETIQVQHGKGDKPRLVPVIPDVIDGIRTYLATRPQSPGSHLWLAYDAYKRGSTGPLTHSGLRQMILRRCKRAGIRYINAHLWRHTFGTEMLNNGAEMSSVSAMLGHSSVKTTEGIYAKWILTGLRREYNEASERIKARL